MAGRDIRIPFGPDKTGGLGIAPIEPENGTEDSSVEPIVADAMASVASGDRPATQRAGEPAPIAVDDLPQPAAITADVAIPQVQADEGEDVVDYHPGGLSEEEATEQGVDHFQMSILALKDSIGQGRELKEREKEREELAEALRADHVELSDREDILANYDSIVAEQDAIIERGTQQRDDDKAEAARVAAETERIQAQLEQKREEYAVQMQPLETELGRVRAAADQAKNDERSRKGELSAAESELRRAGDSAASTVAAAQRDQAEAAYTDARARSEQAKAQLAQVEKVNEEAQERIKQDLGPLERQLEDLNRHAESLKESVNKLGEEISAARKRRQYCDSVYQYPEETAKMRAEVETAEAMVRKMDVENEALRKQLEASRKKARSAKLAIATVIVILIVFIITFIVVSNR